MKYFLTFLSALMLLSSCMGDSYFERKYPLVADFQIDEKFNNDSLWFTTNKDKGFACGDLGFHHVLNSADTKLRGGFALSNMRGRTATTEALPANQYRLYCKNAQKGNIYAVFRANGENGPMPKEHVVFLNKQYGTCTPVGCYIANTEKVVEQIKESFQDGDSLTVVAKGYLNGKLTRELKKNLAKFSADKDSIVSTWTAFDMAKLGNVDRIDFDMISTKQHIDRVFCMDNMVAQIYLRY